MKLDKTEKAVFIWFIIAFLLDVASTIYFISKGKADMEGNILIVLFGWWIGVPLVLLVNVGVIFAFIKALQKYRTKPNLRFGSLSIITSILFIRTFLVPANNVIGAHTVTEVTGHAGTGVSGASSPDILLFWGIFILIILFPVWISQIAYHLFRKNAKVDYDDN